MELPTLLGEGHLRDRTVLVIDVLRATTTIAAALHAGADEVRVFADIDEAREAAADDGSLLAGERRCKPIDGFDFGNSPGELAAANLRGKSLCMTTTNGTRAILATQGAAEVFTVAMVNLSATCKHVRSLGRDVTIVAAGTDGQATEEDTLVAYVVKSGLRQTTDAVSLAFVHAELMDAMCRSRGGKNLVEAGYTADIDVASRPDLYPVVARVEGDRVARVAD
ncbi:MAG: 2-phosphosulfolactate phosphatase [Planctomycetota bacterium]